MNEELVGQECSEILRITLAETLSWDTNPSDLVSATQVNTVIKWRLLHKGEEMKLAGQKNKKTECKLSLKEEITQKKTQTKVLQT